MTKNRPFAVFDIDGTLIRWQLYHALADNLVKRKIIDQDLYNPILAARNNWKSRLSLDSFNDYESSLIKLINDSIKGIDYRVFNEVCNETFNEYKNQVYTFTRDLILSLKQKDYLLFAISGSPMELVRQVALYYKFDDFAASNYEVKANKLTAKSTILYGQVKKTHLLRLIDLHQSSYKDSLGIGDTLGDVDMLELTSRPIAFNPTKELLDVAIKQKWEIVVERKNVIYNLKEDHGQHILV